MDVRVAVIGAGIMGADHARILADEVPGAKVQVVCDALATRAQEVAAACGAEAMTDPLAAIWREDVDAVLVASPDPTHAALTIAAIGLGKPVLCEKPLAPGSDEAWQVVEAEVKLGRRLIQTGFMRRFDPAYVEMKAVQEVGTLGAALMLHCFHRNVSVPPGFTGAMAITNSAPHEFDIARFLLGQEFRAVTAFQPASPGPADRVAPVFLVLETAAGQLVNVEVVNNAAYGYDVRGELVGERGTVHLAVPSQGAVNAGLVAATPFPADWRPRFAEAYRRQDHAWIRSVVSGEPATGAASAWDGYCATRIAEAGVAALAEGRRMEITLPTRPALYD